MKKVSYSLVSVILLTIAFTLPFVSCKKQTHKTENLMDSINYKKTTPEWVKNSNIYEVNVRQYTPEGTFKAFQKQLPRLKEMGVDIIWLMPINPIGIKNRKGTLGSYYSVSNYKAINPESGTENDFKNLVTEAHKLGMHVIIDWVANHTSWDNAWIKNHPDWYTKDSLGNLTFPTGTDWHDAADLDYSKPELRRAMIDAMAYWITTADIDGFGCNVAGMVPLTFWLHARKAIDEIKPDCFFLAEDGEPAIHKAFDMSYDWQLEDIFNDLTKGKKNVSDIVKHFETESKRFQTEDIRMHFTTNHDLNTWDGSEYEKLGDKAVDAFTVLTYTIPGMPLTYTGQEEPLKKRLRFFDKDTVGFKNYERKDLITKLNQLRTGNKALWGVSYKYGFFGLRNTCSNSILSFIRQIKKTQVLCIVNLSDKEQTFKITDKMPENFNVYIGEKITAKTNEVTKLKPWGYTVQVLIR